MPTPAADAGPLAWPAALSARLALLAVVILFFAFKPALAAASLVTRGFDLEGMITCANAAITTQMTAIGSDSMALLREPARCLGALPQTFGLALLGVLSAVATLSILFFQGFPAWIRWREGVRQANVPPAAFTGWIDEEIRAAGLKDRVRVHWRLADPRPQGRAFGRWGAYELLLAGGVLGEWLTAPDRARRIVQHELAHVRHGDVDAFYAARALWWAYLLAVVVPYVALLPASSRQLAVDWLHAAPIETIVVGGMVLVPLAARNLILQDVEHRADLASGAVSLPWMPRPQFFIPGWLRTHPSDAARAAVLAKPARYYRIRPVELTLTGVLLGFSFNFIMLLSVGGFLLGVEPNGLPDFEAATNESAVRVDFTWILLLPSGVTVLFAITLASFVLRDRAGARLGGEDDLGPWRLGAWICVGAVLGIVLTPVANPLSSLTDARGQLRAVFPSDWHGSLAQLMSALLPVAVAALLAVVALMAWLRGLADSWTAALFSRARPKVMLTVAMFLTALPVSLWLTTICLGFGFAFTFWYAGLSFPNAVGAEASVDLPAAAMFAFPAGMLTMTSLGTVLLALTGALPLIGGALVPRPRVGELPGHSPLLSEGEAIRVPDPRPAIIVLGVGGVTLVAGAITIATTPAFAKLYQTLDVPDDPLAALTVFMLLGIIGVAAVAILAAALTPRFRWAHTLALCGFGGFVFIAMMGWMGLNDSVSTPINVGYLCGWLALGLAAPFVALISLLRGNSVCKLTVIRV